MSRSGDEPSQEDEASDERKMMTPEHALVHAVRGAAVLSTDGLLPSSLSACVEELVVAFLRDEGTTCVRKIEVLEELTRSSGAELLRMIASESDAIAEITQAKGEDVLEQSEHDTLKEVVQSLVTMLDEASQIVDFFSKWDEQKTVKKKIKHEILKHYEVSVVKPVTERFMELAQVKFK